MSRQLNSAPTIRNQKKEKTYQVKRNSAFFFSRRSDCLQHASSEQINRCKSLQKKEANIRTGITNYCVNEAEQQQQQQQHCNLHSLCWKKRYNFLDPSLQTPKCTSKCEEPQVEWRYGAQITKKPTTPTQKRNQNATNTRRRSVAASTFARAPFASACARRTTQYGWKRGPTWMRKESY